MLPTLISKKMKTNLNILLSKTSSVPFPGCWLPMSRTHSPKSSRVDPGLFGITTRLRPGSPSAEANAPNSPARAHCEGVLLLNKTCGKSKKSRSKHVEISREIGLSWFVAICVVQTLFFGKSSSKPSHDTFQTGTTKKWGENNKHKPCFRIAITWLISDILQEREILAAYELQELIH